MTELEAHKIREVNSKAYKDERDRQEYESLKAKFG